MTLEQFLELILPSEGFKCWVSIDRNKKITQGLVPTIKELATKLLEIDAHGSDAYFACAVFATNRNRRAGNALGAKIFWLDVDLCAVIDGAKVQVYYNVDAAIAAVDDFADKVGLPCPQVVRSGNGAHVYWILDRMLPAVEWKTLADKFKRLTELRGLYADPKRTADIASILRAPETRNWKIPETPKPVEIMEFDDGAMAEIISAEHFWEVVNAKLSVSPPASAGNHTLLTAGIYTPKVDPSKNVEEGGRNDACYKFACSQLGKNYAPDEVLKQTLEYNQAKMKPPLDEQEATAAAHSAIQQHTANHPATVSTTATVPLTPLFNLSDADVSHWVDTLPPPRNWLFKDSFPLGKVGMLIAPGGTGKSQFLIQIAIALTLSIGVAANDKHGYVWGIPQGGAVLCLFAEEDSEELHRRLHDSIEAMHISDEQKKSLKQRLHMKSVVGEDNLMTRKDQLTHEIRPTSYAERLKLVCEEIDNLRLIIIDPASRFRGGEENSNDDATQFVVQLERLAKQTGASILMAHHTGKSASQDAPDQRAARGASALVDGVRWVCNLSFMTEDEAKIYGINVQSCKSYLKITVTKNNYAPPQETSIWVRRGQHGYLQFEFLVGVKAMQDDGVKKKIVELVRTEKERGKEYSKTGFLDAYAGKNNSFGVGDRTLGGYINKLIEEDVLCEIPPSTKRRNVENVLAVVNNAAREVKNKNADN